MTTYYEFILLIVFYAIAIILTVLSLVWKQISLAMAGAVIWVVLGLNRLLLNGDLTTLNGSIGLISLVMGILTGILPYVTRAKDPPKEVISYEKRLGDKLAYYRNKRGRSATIKSNGDPWYEDEG